VTAEHLYWGTCAKFHLATDNNTKAT